VLRSPDRTRQIHTADCMILFCYILISSKYRILPIIYLVHSITLQINPISGDVLICKVIASKRSVSSDPQRGTVMSILVYPSRAAISTTAITSDVQAFRVLGCASPGDGGGAEYKPGSSSGPMAIQDASGRW